MFASPRTRLAVLLVGSALALSALTFSEKPPESDQVSAAISSKAVLYQPHPPDTLDQHVPTTTNPPPAPITAPTAPPKPRQALPAPQQPSEANSATGDPYSDASWDRLAQCESGGDWTTNTGNGYYGGLQFSLSSWRAVGGSGYPHEAPREEQVHRGQLLWEQGGWDHWPGCTHSFGW